MKKLKSNGADFPPAVAENLYEMIHRMLPKGTVIQGERRENAEKCRRCHKRIEKTDDRLCLCMM